MFDFSATEFLIIALVALIVIGPRELPGLLRQIGQMVGKVRRMASEFQDQLNTAVESSEIQELKTEVGKLADESKIDMDYDPLSDTEREMREAIEGSRPEVQNPDYGNDPDDALVDFSDQMRPRQRNPVLHTPAALMRPGPQGLSPQSPARPRTMQLCVNHQHRARQLR